MKKNIFRTARIILFIFIGVFNTTLFAAGDENAWRNYLGYAFLLAASIDFLIYSVQTIRKNEDLTEAE